MTEQRRDTKDVDEVMDPVESGSTVPDSGLAGGDVRDDAQASDIGRPIPADKGVAQRDRHPLDTDED
jgi:hypothetical protein